jgi:hypothetical protein
LVSNLCLNIFLFVLTYVAFSLQIQTEDVFNHFFYFAVFEQLYSASMVSVGHIFENPPYLSDLIAIFNILSKSISMSSNFSNKGIPSYLEDKRYGEMRVILLLFQSSFDHSSSVGGSTNLFLSEL